MNAPKCSCGRPVADNARLCSGCTGRLMRDLGDLGGLADELQTTRLRQSRTGGQATGVLSRAYERPLPWNERASQTADLLRATVVAWVRIVLEDRGKCPDDTIQACGTFLLHHLEHLRHAEWAPEIADEIHHVVTEAQRVIDLAPDRLYIGPCDPDGRYGEAPCPTHLYARQGAAEATCPDCGLVWNVQNRREVMLDAAQDQLATAADLSKFLSVYGEPLTAERIRKWAERGQLAPHGRTATGGPLYLVSEVVARLAEHQIRKSA